MRNSRRSWPKRLAGASFLALTAAAAHAGEWQAPHSITAAAREFVEARLPAARGRTVITAADVDPRVKLRACAQPLEAFLPPGGALRHTTSVGVRCAGPVRWKLYVPVRLETRTQVARLTRALPPGHRLTADDYEWVEQLQRPGSTALERGIQDPGDRILRTAAGAGQLLQAAMLEPAWAVRRGERVTLASGGSALAIRMQGEALADGVIGQKIRARNVSSGRVIEGVVRARGLLEIHIY